VAKGNLDDGKLSQLGAYVGVESGEGIGVVAARTVVSDGHEDSMRIGTVSGSAESLPRSCCGIELAARNTHNVMSGFISGIVKISAQAAIRGWLCRCQACMIRLFAVDTTTARRMVLDARAMAHTLEPWAVGWCELLVSSESLHN